MATVKRFEELVVWQMAQEQGNQFYPFVTAGKFKGHYPLQDQVNRSSASVMDNIVGEFVWFSKADFRHFLVMARGSNAEFRSQLHRALSRNILSEVQFQELKKASEYLGVKLHHFIGYLSQSSLNTKPTPENPYQVQENAIGYNPYTESDYPEDFFSPY